jgi:hypothetical protein
MKRIALLLFGLTLTVGMIGCAEKKAETPAPTAETAPADEIGNEKGRSHLGPSLF